MTKVRRSQSEHEVLKVLQALIFTTSIFQLSLLDLSFTHYVIVNDHLGLEKTQVVIKIFVVSLIILQDVIDLCGLQS